MNTIKNMKGLLIAAGLIFLAGCSDFLEENPPHIMTSDKLYTSVDGYESGIDGLYALMRQEREGYRITTGFGHVGLRAIVYMAGTDNVAANTTGELSTIMTDWKRYNVTTDPGLKSLFSWLYQVVNLSNTIIIRAEKSDINWGNDETKYRIIAEAHLARAWAYRHLTYLWGNVPLVLTEPSGSNIRADFTRDPVSAIRKVMIADLRYAEEYLPWKPAKVGHASKGVALTYLSEMYLAVNKPDSALFFANKCIDEGPYQLITKRYGSKSQGKGVTFMDMFQPENVNIETGNT
ncbi:MAG: RagB/SusD family nutrient uptake outer membrane protein, partial [Candidatus Azobacteroides sp.]|nr:RagB/SusD family nutrient uptake outer membrane protein [Candidatus Azobacteroides sp.]